MTTAIRTMNTAAPVATTSYCAASRSTSDDVESIPKVLKSEWIKLSSVRANKAIFGLTTAAGGFVAWAVATLVTKEVQTASQVFIFSTVLTGVFAAVAGILLFSSEAQHGTLATALTAQPARWVLVAAKTMMAAAFGLVLGAAGMAASFGGALLGGLALGDTSAMAATTLWALLFTALSAVLGLGIGMIVRHSSGAISAVLVWGWSSRTCSPCSCLSRSHASFRSLPVTTCSPSKLTAPSPNRRPPLSPELKTHSSSVATPPRH
jgi:ABC-2 type transport system permease protein